MQVAASSLLLMLLLALAPNAVAQLTPIADGNFYSAVFAWADRPTTATRQYGDIAGWNVAAVTDMSRMHWLFNNFRAFNADISKWNVASVGNMNCMFFTLAVFHEPLLALKPVRP
jgi:surface protein